MKDVRKTYIFLRFSIAIFLSTTSFRATSGRARICASVRSETQRETITLRVFASTFPLRLRIRRLAMGGRVTSNLSDESDLVFLPEAGNSIDFSNASIAWRRKR